MIEFKGELSELNGKFLASSLRKDITASMMIVAYIAVMPLVVLLTFLLSYVCVLLLLMPPILILAVTYGEYKDDFYITHYAPNNVMIDVDTIISIGAEFEESRGLSDVKKVIDNGLCYYIKMRYRFRVNGYVYFCQKDLMTQGTIEEFEELFKDKLVRKEISVSENSVGMEPPVEKVVERRNTESNAEQPKSRRWDIVIFVMTFIFGIANVALSTAFYVRGKQEYIVSLALTSLGIVITALLLILYCKRKPKVGASGMTAYSMAALIFITVATITFVIPILV